MSHHLMGLSWIQNFTSQDFKVLGDCTNQYSFCLNARNALTHLLNQYSKLTTKDTIAAIKLAVIIDMPSMLKDMMYTNMVIITTIITTFMTFQMKNDMSYYRFD